VLVKGNTILFEFLNANLADGSNKFKSVGYIKFKVRPKTNVPVGSIITNRATLYFDYDNAINTNTVTTVVNATGTLPVKLTRFDCVLKEKNKVVSTWETAIEQNVSHYNVLRSSNGKDFAAVGKVKATGKVIYSFTDANLPELNSNILYYRLEMVDNDGSKALSDIKTVRLKPAAINFVMYPNPSKGNVSVEAFDVNRVIVLDYLGRKIYEKTIGNTTHSITNITGLTKGVYFVQTISVSGERNVQKLMIE
jgi:hypothetical protein